MVTEWEVDPFFQTNNAPTRSDCLVKLELTRLGEPKFLYGETFRPARRVTLLPSQQSWPCSAGLSSKLVRHVSCLMTSARQGSSPVGQASDSCTQDTISPYKRCLSAATFYLSFRSSDGKLLPLVHSARLTLNTLTLDS